MARTIGYHPDGKIAFQSQNLRGLIVYGRKHGVTRVDLGDCISISDGLYTVHFSNGVVCKGTFADPRVMLGFFLGRGFISQIECDRTVFNKGAALGRVHIPTLYPLGQHGSMNFGMWVATAYRDTTQTPMVRFVPLRSLNQGF